MCYEKTLVKKAERFLELQAQIKALEAEQAEVKDFIKSELDARGVDILNVKGYVISNKSISSNRFDSKAFKAVNEELYTQYLKESVSKRFEIKVTFDAVKDN